MADYRIKALASMEQTVDSLNDEVGKAKTYIATRRDLAALPPANDKAVSEMGGM